MKSYSFVIVRVYLHVPLCNYCSSDMKTRPRLGKLGSAGSFIMKTNGIALVLTAILYTFISLESRLFSLAVYF